LLWQLNEFEIRTARFCRWQQDETSRHEVAPINKTKNFNQK